jgi:hypothetical protein
LKQEWQKSAAGTRQTDGKNFVWFGEIERKTSQIIKDYFCLPFFLLIILCCPPFIVYTVHTFKPSHSSHSYSTFVCRHSPKFFTILILLMTFCCKYVRKIPVWVKIRESGTLFSYSSLLQLQVALRTNIFLSLGFNKE